MSAAEDLAIVELADRAAWEDWLEANHAAAPGVWLKIAKKGSGSSTVNYAEALEVALCHGWIDGQKRPFDDKFWLQRFTPRGPRSKWSRINRDKATDLIARREMRPAGLARVEEARADGRWDAAYESQSRATVPEDFQAALDESSEAKAFFATLTSANRYAFLYRIADAKRPETRARRIEQFVAMLAEHRTFH